jgi:hypothetical protein
MATPFAGNATHSASVPPCFCCVASLKEVVDALITGGLLVSDAPAHLKLDVVQVLGPQRRVVLEVWPWD